MAYGRHIVAGFSALMFVACGQQPIAEPDTRFTLGDGGVSEFYSYTDSLPEEPGILLRQEALSDTQSVPGAAENIRLLYTSTNGLDGKTRLAVSGSLFLPQGTPPAGGWPLLLWSHGTVGIADICAPSWTGYVPFHNEHLEAWLDEGYAIVASDYQGLGTAGTHPYLATRPAAYSNLDVIRAVQRADFPVSDKVVVAGQSQGAGAAIATIGHRAGYAPETKLVGLVATGVPYFTPEALIAVQQARPRDVVDPQLGYNYLALTLIAQVDPGFDVEDYVSDEALPLAQGVQHICNRDMRGKISEAGLTYDASFKQNPSEPLKKAFALMQYPTLDLDVPVFVGTGAADRDTPVRMQAGFIKAACAAGSNIQSHLYDDHDHLTALNRSLEESRSFASTAFAGEEVNGNCDDLPFAD